MRLLLLASFLMSLLIAPQVFSKTVELECRTERNFDGEEYGVNGDKNIDRAQAFVLTINMDYAKAAMQQRDYRDVVLSPTVIMMKHTQGPGSDGKTYVNTTEITRDTLEVKTALFQDKRRVKQWEGKCDLAKKS